MWQMFDKTRNQMINWGWANPCAFRDQVNRSTLPIANKQKLTTTGEIFCWHSSDDLQAMIQPRSCQQYWPVDLLATRPQNCDLIINEDDDNGNLANFRAPSDPGSHHGNGNDREDSDGRKNM
jgi:hypothetical protein